MLERRIDDYWNIDVSRDLSDSWTGFTQFTPLEEKPPEGYMWSTRKQLTSRPDHLWPELWRGMSNQTLCGLRFGKICLMYRNAKRSINVQLKNQSSIMQEDYEESISLTPEDLEFEEIIKNARRKSQTPMAPAMPCKICKKSKHWETRSKTNDFKSKFACILEASDSTRMRTEESLPKYHEDHIAGKGDNSLSITIWYTILIPCLEQ